MLHCWGTKLYLVYHWLQRANCLAQGSLSAHVYGCFWISTILLLVTNSVLRSPRLWEALCVVLLRGSLRKFHFCLLTSVNNRKQCFDTDAFSKLCCYSGRFMSKVVDDRRKNAPLQFLSPQKIFFPRVSTLLTIAPLPNFLLPSFFCALTQNTREILKLACLCSWK